MDLTPMVVRYAATGLRAAADGSVTRTNHLFAKVSRPEVAARFMAPAPAAILDELVRLGQLRADEAELARRVPVAEDLTVEADSGGHTDNQALTAVFPTVARARDQAMRDRDYARPIRLGAAGGLGTPDAIAGAFALGAAYVLTGSVNQSAVESGLSDDGKRLLCQAALDDVMMAPAADMFEMGVKVQVLKRGAMFGVRAQKLYEVYRRCASLDDIPADERARLEREVFGAPLDEVWSQTKAFFAERDPSQNERAARDDKHRMALVFRWYLGQSSRWAIAGDPARKLDFQIWCGPAMGAFNAWAKGSFFESPAERTVVQIARNLLEGAAVVTRAQQLRSYGVAVPAAAFAWAPRPLA
jgi:PfaD family protein